MTAPLRVRPGTTDEKVFRDVYLRRKLAHALPFRPRSILDVGAYTGISTRWLSDRYPDARVRAVEANPSLGPLLRSNAPRAEVELVAVGPPGTVGLRQRGGRGQWAYYVTEETEGALAVVERRPLEEIITEDWPDLVKMDVEGAERWIFREERTWLQHVRAIFLETHDRFLPGCKAAVRQALKETGRPYAREGRGGEDTLVIFTDGGA